MPLKSSARCRMNRAMVCLNSLHWLVLYRKIFVSAALDSPKESWNCVCVERRKEGAYKFGERRKGLFQSLCHVTDVTEEKESGDDECGPEGESHQADRRSKAKDVQNAAHTRKDLKRKRTAGRRRHNILYNFKAGDWGWWLHWRVRSSIGLSDSIYLPKQSGIGHLKLSMRVLTCF